MYITLNNTLSNQIPNTSYYCQNHIQLSVEEVSKALNSLKFKNTAGVDNVPSFVLKSATCILAEPLSVIFNIRLRTNTFPNDWKITRVVAVYKSGDKNDIKNYRLISIIPNFAKVFEKAILKHVTYNLSLFIADEQHGCINNCSTATNLICITESIIEAILEGYQLDVIYTDFSKAFDTVDHNLLFANFLI